MVDNFDLIRDMLIWDDPDKFYYVQILQRKEDHKGRPHKLGPNNSSRSIKNYYIDNLKDFLFFKEEMIKLCDLFNARASIRLNRRSYKKCAYKTLQKMANIMANREYSHVGRARSKAIGDGHDEGKGKTWILDIDADEDDVIHESPAMIYTFLEEARPIGNKFVGAIPSKTGTHIISKPFDLRGFKEKFPDIEIHKDNPTNLYIP